MAYQKWRHGVSLLAAVSIRHTPWYSVNFFTFIQARTLLRAFGSCVIKSRLHCLYHLFAITRHPPARPHAPSRGDKFDAGVNVVVCVWFTRDKIFR